MLYIEGKSLACNFYVVDDRFLTGLIHILQMRHGTLPTIGQIMRQNVGRRGLMNYKEIMHSNQ